MLGIVGYGGFVASAAALCLTPGIDTVYILTRTVSGGRREGLASAFGINAGLVVHTILVAAGLSLLLAASPVAFNVIKVAGAAYLAVMGVRSILSGGSSFSVGERVGEPAAGSNLRVFAQGVLTNVLNPKIILLLGLTYVALSTLWTVVIVLVAAPFSRLLTRSPRAGRVTAVVSGLVYIALGATIFLTA